VGAMAAALDCLDDKAVAAGVLIYNDSHWAVYASNGSPLIAAFSGMRGWMRRPRRLPVLALMMVHKGRGYPSRWLWA
jgi:hypothetical protein